MSGLWEKGECCGLCWKELLGIEYSYYYKIVHFNFYDSSLKKSFREDIGISSDANIRSRQIMLNMYAKALKEEMGRAEWLNSSRKSRIR